MPWFAVWFVIWFSIWFCFRFEFFGLVCWGRYGPHISRRLLIERCLVWFLACGLVFGGRCVVFALIYFTVCGPMCRFWFDICIYGLICWVFNSDVIVFGCHLFRRCLIVLGFGLVCGVFGLVCLSFCLVCLCSWFGFVVLFVVSFEFRVCGLVSR